MNFFSLKTPVLFLCMLVLAVGCDSVADTDLSDENSDLKENSFVVEVKENENLTDHEGAATASLSDFTGVSVDSALVSGKVLQIDLQLESDTEVYFSIRREGESVDELMQLGTYNLGVSDNEQVNSDGFQGKYRKWLPGSANQTAICETGSVTLDAFTLDQITGSFSCEASQREQKDENGDVVQIDEPISLAGSFVVGVAVE